MGEDSLPQSNNKRIAKNTLMLYIRQLLTLVVSLYTVRVILNVLGVEDYGIYNVIGGIVSFFAFLSSTMASATQRFFSFAIGQKDFDKLKRIFSVNWIIYGLIAAISLILLETAGLWFVNERLEVPLERFESARQIFHYSVLTFISTILTTPFMAIIVAHEDMHIYAYVSIVETILKLTVVFLLDFLPGDKLELYGILVFAVSALNAGMYILICTRKYNECQFRQFYWDNNLFKEIIGFTGWTLFGQLTTVGRNQAVTILLNQLFNPVVVAARAIAINITSQINLFSNNFNMGLYPPIIKSYAADDKGEMFSLISRGSKITFSLMWIFALPLFIEMNAILNLWLKNPPLEAALFTRLALVDVLISSISLPLATAARAPGKMKNYELILGSIQIGIFVASWLVLKAGATAYSVFLVAIIANLVMFVVRLFIVKSLLGFPLRPFYHKVVIPVSLVILSSGVPSFIISFALPKHIIYSFLSMLLSVLFSIVSMYYIGLEKDERERIKSLIISRTQKYLNIGI
ncbi:lipopolysaccharide biosynthesis protein [Dyadobacter sp. MSC1_007]|jgi:O-antigen/teichoic acid export membrane protein|uniref:lipopolysaccharide biosynthesis protein n=1 Tax=Dyadobacter sp. MSC1_007 TaxID=2909264 RepID=UPI0020305749|nr:oligosaccharide flippase family protein [Dyadobacter sp. MSC1_007]